MILKSDHRCKEDQEKARLDQETAKTALEIKYRYEEESQIGSGKKRNTIIMKRDHRYENGKARFDQGAAECALKTEHRYEEESQMGIGKI